MLYFCVGFVTLLWCCYVALVLLRCVGVVTLRCLFLLLSLLGVFVSKWLFCFFRCRVDLFRDEYLK